MAIDTYQKPESDQLLIASQGEGSAFSFEAEEIDIIGFRLWRRANNLGMAADDCDCCKGEAQKCLAICQ
jgi:hypothetical protein